MAMAEGNEVSNKQIALRDYVSGFPKESDLVLRTGTIRLKVPEGSNGVVVKNLYLASDPYMRGLMRKKEGSYVPGLPITGYGVARVVDSGHPNFKKGDLVWGITGWEEYSLIKSPETLFKIQNIDVPLSYYTGILGADWMLRNAASINAASRPDGRTDSTSSFHRAWEAACESAQPATIYVPPGRYLLGISRFFGPCKNNAITFRIDGTLVAPSDFRVLGNADNWFLFERVHGVTILGGVLDGQGAALWACKTSTRRGCPSGATTLGVSNSNNIMIWGLTSLDSQMFNIVINGCNNVKLEEVKVLASGNSPNTDGIHVQFSSAVTIFNSRISTGDDCVSVGAGTTNLWIENVACGPGHGISIGSLGKELEEPGVQNVTVKKVVFTGTQNGLRIKTWGRPSNGFVRGVLFQHAIMVNAQNPIVIDQNYCPHHKCNPNEISGVKISDVTYQGIWGSSATEVAVKFDCSKAHPCSGVRLEDVSLTYRQHYPAKASCSNAEGTASGFIRPASCLQQYHNLLSYLNLHFFDMVIN